MFMLCFYNINKHYFPLFYEENYGKIVLAVEDDCGQTI